MEQTLEVLTDWIGTMSRGSPIIQTALFSILTVAVSGFLGIILINLPKKIKDFIWTQCTVETLKQHWLVYQKENWGITKRYFKQTLQSFKYTRGLIASPLLMFLFYFKWNEFKIYIVNVI